MAKYAPIRREMNWFRYERKQLLIEVPDVDLTDLELEWRLYRGKDNRTIYLDKDDVDVDGSGTEVAIITIEETEYDTEYLELLPGWYYHELWDATDHALLAYGGALLQRARA